MSDPAGGDAETWPSQWIVESWQGDFGFQFRPGEDSPVHDPAVKQYCLARSGPPGDRNSKSSSPRTSNSLA